MAVQALLAAGSLLGGVFGSSGPDATKVAERTGQVAAAKSLAAQGNVLAWQVLGAIGQVVPLPPGGASFAGETYRGNWTSKDWGDAYNPIVNDARAAYNAFAPLFARSGVAQTIAQVTDISLGQGAPPVMTAATGGADSAQGPVTGLMAKLNGIPTWLIVLAGVLLLLLLLRR